MLYFIGNSWKDSSTPSVPERWRWVENMNYLSRRVCVSHLLDYDEYDDDDDDDPGFSTASSLRFYRYSDYHNDWGIRLDNAVPLRVKRRL